MCIRDSKLVLAPTGMWNWTAGPDSCGWAGRFDEALATGGIIGICCIFADRGGQAAILVTCWFNMRNSNNDKQLNGNSLFYINIGHLYCWLYEKPGKFLSYCKFCLNTYAHAENKSDRRHKGARGKLRGEGIQNFIFLFCNILSLSSRKKTYFIIATHTRWQGGETFIFHHCNTRRGAVW